MKLSSYTAATGATANRLRSFKKISDKHNSSSSSSQVAQQVLLDLEDEDQPYDLTTQNEESIELAAQKIKLRHDHPTTEDIELALNKEILPKEIPEDNEEDSDDEDIIMDDEDKNKTNNLKQSAVAESKLKYNLDDLNGLSQSNSKFCKVLVHLLLKNKISSKNAFDIKIPILDQLAGIDFSQHSAWKLLSSGLGAGAKIWGYKVDNTYGDTMKVLQKLFRIDAFDQEEMKLLNSKGPAGIKQKKQQMAFNIEEASKNADNAGSKTLEQHTDCLNADLYDLEFDKDPTFWRTSLSFDIKSAETMLLNKLPMDSNFGYVVDSEEKITLRVDKRLEEIEERVDSGANSANPQIDKSMKSFVIRRKGQERSSKVTLYEVIVGQVEEINEADRERQIAEIIRSTHTLLPLDKNNGKLVSTLEDGLCEELTQFASFVQSEDIFSESTQRWSYKDKRRDQKLAQYDLDRFQLEHQSLESRREEGKREQERLDRENKVGFTNIAEKNNENSAVLEEEQAQDNEGKISKGQSMKQIVEMVEGEEVEIDIEPITVIETGIDGNNYLETVNLNETANNNNDIDTPQDGMDEEPNNLETNYIKLLRDQQEALISEDDQTQKTEWNEHVAIKLEERKVVFNEQLTQPSISQQGRRQEQQELQQDLGDDYVSQNYQTFDFSENLQNYDEMKNQQIKNNPKETNYSSMVIASFFGGDAEEEQEKVVDKVAEIGEKQQIQRKDIENNCVEEKKLERKELQRVEEVEQVFLEGDEMEIDIDIQQGDQQILEEDDGVHVLSQVQNKNLRRKKDFDNVIEEILKRSEKPRENSDIDLELRVLNRGDIRIGKGLKKQILWLQNQGQIEVVEEENGQLCLRQIEDGNISESSSQESDKQDENDEYYNPFALNMMDMENQREQINKKHRNEDWSDESSVDICEQFLGDQFQERLEEKKKERYFQAQKKQFEKKMARMQAEREELGGETDGQGLEVFSGKTNKLRASKRMEEEVEEEFRRMLEGEEINGAADALEMIVRCKSKRGSSKSLWIDFQEEEEEEESSSLIVFIDPYERIRRALGQQYNQSDNDLLTGNELKNKKYVWGYKSVCMDIAQSESEGVAMFESKLFNVGKGTHRIDMRYSSLQQQKLKLHVDQGNQLQEFQLIQTSKLKLGRTREDWQRRKDRFNTKNLLYFNRILEGKEENYLCVVQPRLRTVKNMIDQEKRTRQRYRGWAQQNRRMYFQSLYPRREILYILTSCLNLDSETLRFVDSICEDYLHYLSLPTLTHFEVTKSIQKQFEDTVALTMDISFDEIVDDREKDTENSENNDEIDFNLLDIGLYDALEIDRGGSFIQPSYSSARNDLQKGLEGLNTSGNAQNRRESSSKQWDQISRQLQQAADAEVEVKILDDAEVKILDEADVKILEELEGEVKNRDNLEQELDSHMNEIGDVKEEENAVGNSKLTQNIKKKTISSNRNARGVNEKRRKKKKAVRIDLEKYSRDPSFIGDSSDSLNNSSSAISEEDGGDANQFNDSQLRNLQDVSYHIDVNNLAPTGIVTRKQKRKIDEFCGIVSDENIHQNDSDSLEIELGEYDTAEQASQQLLHSLHKKDQEIIFEEGQQHNQTRGQQEIDIQLSFSSLDENDNNNNEDILKFIPNGKIAKYFRNQENNTRLPIFECNDNYNNNDLSNTSSDMSIDSVGSIQEQYFHKEYAAYLPYNLDKHELSSFEPMVKWEVKLEETYDDFRSKYPYSDYTHLAPNVILLDSIKESEELAGQKYFLEELNNMRLFSNYKVFIPPLVTDYMGMANKIHMKELIIKIWLRIKKQIKTAKQIQVGEKPFSFFDLLLQMPELVGAQNAKAISQQTVFQVILHLANLKHLRLAQDDSNLNFYILQE